MRDTSRVCSVCSNVKRDLGGNTTYNCNNCGFRMDRDVNGCRGILIKGMESETKYLAGYGPTQSKRIRKRQFKG